MQMLYDEFILVGNVCSISVCTWVLGQLFYNGTQIVQSLKQQPFSTTIGTILRASFCGIVAFVTNPKYSQVPGIKNNLQEGIVETGMQGKEVIDGGTGPNWVKLTKGRDSIQGPFNRGLPE